MMNAEQVISLLVALGAGGMATKALDIWFQRRKEKHDGSISITLSEREELREIHKRREDELHEVRRQLEELRDRTIEKYQALQMEYFKEQFSCNEKAKQIEALQIEIKEMGIVIEQLRAELNKRD